MNDLESGEDATPGGLETEASTPRGSSQDLAWESELVQLLSTLDSCRARLYDDCAAGKALPAVEILLAVAKGVAAFARSRFSDGPADVWQPVQASMDAFSAAVRPLHDRLDDNVFRMLARVLWRPRYDRDLHEQFRDAACKLRAYLNDVFVLCAGRFRSSFAAQSWTDTYTVFLEELDGLVEQVHA